MSRCDFSRTPFARQPWEFDEIIPAIPEGPVYDSNSPLAETEVRFTEDPSERKRSIYFDWHEQDRELEIVAGYNPIGRDLLNAAITETESVHGPIKTLVITLARDNARAHARVMLDLGFQRIQDRNRTTWSYERNIEELRKAGRQRPKKVKPPKVEPEHVKEDIRPLMSLEQYREAEQKRLDLLAEIDRLRRLRDEHAGKDIT